MTETQEFGSGKRVSHDATRFYERFAEPKISLDERVERPENVQDGYVTVGDARDMALVPGRSVALVVTSPPYFTGRSYERGDDSPATFEAYLRLLVDVFAECRRVLEPGGRIAVNVANIGRRPYRHLAAEMVEVFGVLGLHLRGEIVWRKAEGRLGRARGGRGARRRIRCFGM